MMDFTVIAASRHRFGDNIQDEKPSVGEIERGLETDAPLVGLERSFQFLCPNVDPRESAILLFQAQGVTERVHTFELNGQAIFGGIPTSVESDHSKRQSGPRSVDMNAFWSGTIALINPGMLREANSLLIRVKEFSYSGAIIDDFIIDNMVMLFKTRAGRPYFPGDVLDPSRA
jgi:hypothetical protein